MLKCFTVENFKGIKEKVVFDLTAHDYHFNKQLINNNIVNKALIYGNNGSCKSTLGIALFDILSHLTNKYNINQKNVLNYLNLESNKKEALFKYIFKFNNDEVIYEYSKKSINDLGFEKLTINKDIIVHYNYDNDSIKYINNELLGNLNLNLYDNKTSIIKYIYLNIHKEQIPLLNEMISFCDNMLYLSNLSIDNISIDNDLKYSNIYTNIIDKLYQSNKLKEFESFLYDNNGIKYNLEFNKINQRNELFVVFGNNKVPFLDIASKSSKVLLTFYVLSLDFDNLSFLFIDNFDLYINHNILENIIKIINNNEKFQAIVTLNNTYLMQNELTRPDCCYIYKNNKISNLSCSTDKEIREGHNLEKMYLNNVFN